MACTQTLINIARQCGKVRGGIMTAYAINRDKIGTITVTDGAVTAITLAAGAEAVDGDGFYTYEFRPNTANFTTAGNADDSGRAQSYTSTLTFEFPKMETAKRVALQALVETEAYMVVRDNNKKYWLFGYDSSVAANVNGETGSTYTDNNQYVLTVTDNSMELPMEITMSEADFEALLNENL